MDQDYITDMDDLYSELSLEKLDDKACGQNINIVSEWRNGGRFELCIGEKPKM